MKEFKTLSKLIELILSGLYEKGALPYCTKYYSIIEICKEKNITLSSNELKGFVLRIKKTGHVDIYLNPQDNIEYLQLTINGEDYYKQLISK